MPTLAGKAPSAIGNVRNNHPEFAIVPERLTQSKININSSDFRPGRRGFGTRVQLPLSPVHPVNAVNPRITLSPSSSETSPWRSSYPRPARLEVEEIESRGSIHSPKTLTKVRTNAHQINISSPDLKSLNRRLCTLRGGGDPHLGHKQAESREGFQRLQRCPAKQSVLATEGKFIRELSRTLRTY